MPHRCYRACCAKGEPEASSGHDPARETGERGRVIRAARAATGGPDPAIPSSDAPARGQNGANRCRSHMASHAGGAGLIRRQDPGLYYSPR